MPRKDVYSFRKILDKRLKNNQLEYYIQWYDGSEGWIPHYDVLCPWEVNHFKNSYKSIKSAQRLQRILVGRFSQEFCHVYPDATERRYAAEETFRLTTRENIHGYDSPEFVHDSGNNQPYRNFYLSVM